LGPFLFRIIAQAMKKYITLLSIGLAISLNSFAQKNEIALVIAPLEFEEQSSYQAMYRRSLNEKYTLRAGLRLLVDTDRETRNDTALSFVAGTVQYDLSIGVQHKLFLDDLENLYLYAGIDGYFNSEFNRKSYETYYGYYWSMGLKPLVGLAYEPLKNVRLSFEFRSNLNVNLQDYSAPGENIDRRFTYRPLDQLSLGIGYLF